MGKGKVSELRFYFNSLSGPVMRSVECRSVGQMGVFYILNS